MRKAQPGREASGDKGQWGRPQPGPARRRALLPAPHSRPPARHGSPHLSLSPGRSLRCFPVPRSPVCLLLLPPVAFPILLPPRSPPHSPRPPFLPAGLSLSLRPGASGVSAFSPLLVSVVFNQFQLSPLHLPGGAVLPFSSLLLELLPPVAPSLLGAPQQCKSRGPSK